MNQISRGFGVVVLLLLVAACTSQREADTVEVGQDIAVTKADGGVVEGKVASLDDKNVQVTTGKTTRSIPKDQIVDVTVVDQAKPTELPPAAKFREYTVPEGTALSLRLATAINSGTGRVEDPVEATLAQAVSVGGAEVLPAGSTLKGTVSAVEASGKIKGLASITLHFTSVAAAGRDDRYDIDAAYSETAEATKGSDAKKIGIGAGAVRRRATGRHRHRQRRDRRGDPILRLGRDGVSLAPHHRRTADLRAGDLRAGAGGRELAHQACAHQLPASRPLSCLRRRPVPSRNRLVYSAREVRTDKFEQGVQQKAGRGQDHQIDQQGDGEAE